MIGPKRTTAFALLALLLLGTALAPGKEHRGMTLREAIDRTRSSMVQITYSVRDFSPEFVQRTGIRFDRGSLGTGFFVTAEGHVITAWHVIKNGGQLLERTHAQTRKIQVGVPIPDYNDGHVQIRGSFSIVDFDLIDKDETHDIALLKLKRNPFKGEVKAGIVSGSREVVPMHVSVASLSDVHLHEGMVVATSGYPLNQPVLVTTSGHIASSSAWQMTETHPPGAPEWFKMPEAVDVYFADLEANPGNSGGPVYTPDDGQIIGICLASLSAPVLDAQTQQGVTTQEGHPLVYASRLTVVLPSRFVIDLLKKNGISPMRYK